MPEVKFGLSRYTILVFLVPMVIGITGLIGSGKSTAARILKSLGAAVIDADKIGRQVVDRNPELLAKLVRRFGQAILSRGGKLNRKKLATLAFDSGTARQKLDRAVHPYLLKELKKQLRIHKGKRDLIVIDAALLLNWNLDRVIDLVIMIHASEKDRLARLAKRGISNRDARARQKQQMSYAEQRSRVDYVVMNNGTERQLGDRLRRILRVAARKTG